MASVEIKQPFDRTGASEKRARWGDWTLFGLSGGATLLTVLTFGMLVWKIIEQATPAVHKFGSRIPHRQHVERGE